MRRTISYSARFLLLLLLGGSFMVLPRSTRAEFEIPYLDSTNSLASVEFRGMWGFNRGYSNSVLYEGFESYAVGVDKSNNDPNSNGVFYYNSGTGWVRVVAPLGTTSGTPKPVFSVNAMSGQNNYSDGNPWVLWMAGVDGKVASIDTYTGTPGVGSNTFTTRTLAGETRDFYAIDASQSFNYPYIAGGQAGLYATGTPGNILKVTPTVTNDGGRTALLAGENITGIRFSNLDSAYIITSTFQDGDRYADSGWACSGSQTGRLYKVDTGSLNKWSYLGSAPTCFYGLAIGTRNSDSSDHGPQRNVVWIGTGNGIWKFDENATSPTIAGPITGSATGAGRAIYSVTAIKDRGGSGINVVDNGGFENWENPIHPDNWVPLDNTYGKNNGSGFNAGVCGVNDNDILRVPGSGSTYAVQIWPGPAYSNSNCTTGFIPRNTKSVFSRVDLSTIEGQRFKISGDYKVEFPDLAAAGAPAAPAPQGGVVVACTGFLNAQAPGYGNCSYSNRSFVRTAANPTSGWEHFEMTISRQDEAFQFIERAGQGASYSLQDGRMVLELRCEATYGAKVTCDNLKVEELSTPSAPAHDTFTVIGVGQNRTIVSNTNGLSASSTFVAEQQPAFDVAVSSDPYSAIYGVGLQHAYIGGSNSTILSRTPSTLVGFIWAGTGDSTGGANGQGTGYISVSCINTRDVNGKTLCQQSPASYGLTLEYTNATRSQGDLQGRSWFGKNLTGVDDHERISVGSCLKKEILTDPTNLIGAGTYAGPYDIHGLCNQTSRRCYASRVDAVKGAAGQPASVSNYSCVTDFDCLGRCSADQGFLCANDGDCQISSATDQTGNFYGTPNFALPPSLRLSCGAGGSPLSCTSGGWLSFNKDDFDIAHQTAPDGSTIGVQYNTQYPAHNVSAAANNKGFHELSGWARFMTLASAEDPNYHDSGWVHLQGGAVTPTGKLFSCQDCYGSDSSNFNCAFCRDDLGHSCKPSSTAGTGAGQAQCSYYCQNNPTITCVNDNNCPQGDTCKPRGYCSTNPSKTCTTDASCGGNGYCASGATCSLTGATCKQYGVNISTETGQYSGFAWSDDYGWLDFRGVGKAGARFFQTRLGDIYATGQVGNPQSTQPAGINNCNATFLILSSQSIASNWCSAISTTLPGGLTAKQPYISPIQLPSSANIYQNILGRFDLTGMETPVRTTGSKQYNKYDSEVVTLDTVPGSGANLNSISNVWLPAIQASGPTKSLGGRIFVVPKTNAGGQPNGDGTGNFILNSAMQFYNSNTLAADGSGAGMLVVNGNLTIQSPLAYSNLTATIDDIRKLQNLVIVVRGDLYIDNAVQNLVGSYYVTGTVHTTNSTSGNGQYPLQVRGLMIAGNFDFGRRFAGTVENPAPSELIIFDGRLQSNPLPGMTDFVKSLPSTVAQP